MVEVGYGQQKEIEDGHSLRGPTGWLVPVEEHVARLVPTAGVWLASACRVARLGVWLARICRVARLVSTRRGVASESLQGGRASVYGRGMDWQSLKDGCTSGLQEPAGW